MYKGEKRVLNFLLLRIGVWKGREAREVRTPQAETLKGAHQPAAGCNSCCGLVPPPPPPPELERQAVVMGSTPSACGMLLGLPTEMLEIGQVPPIPKTHSRELLPLVSLGESLLPSETRLLLT